MTSSTQATANEAKDRAADVKDTATEQAAQVTGTVKEQTGQVVQEATAQARNLLEEARGQVREQTLMQRDRLREFLDSFAEELENMATAGGRDGVATEVVRQVAAKTRSITSSFGSMEGSDALESVRSFARRRPGTFLLAAGLAGVLAGRATRGAKELQSGSGGQSRELGAYDTRYGASGYGTTGYGTTGSGTATGYAATGAAYGTAGGYEGEYAGTQERLGYPAAGYAVGGAEYEATTTAGTIGEPIVTETYVAPAPVTIDLTSRDDDDVETAAGEARTVRPGDETEWAPVANRSAADRYGEEGR